MAGFLDDQNLMSSNGLGVFAYDYDTVVLKDGSVILGYFGSSTGNMQFFKYAPATGTTTFLSSMGGFSSGFESPNLIANGNGGFSVVMKNQVGFLTTDGRVTKYDFDKSAALQGSTELASGFVEEVTSVKTSKGFFVSYRDRDSDAPIEYVGEFYDNAGNLLKTYDFDDGRGVLEHRRANPEIAVLNNGNLVAVWKLSDGQGDFMQVFKPNGTPVGSKISLKSMGFDTSFDHKFSPVAHPDGGFVVFLDKPASGQNDAVIQRFSNTGTKIGKEIAFDATTEAPFPFIGEASIGFTKEGLMVVAWSSDGQTDNDRQDVLISVYSTSGKLIAGPLLASESALDDQYSVDFLSLKNGNLLLTFFDDTNIQFSHQGSIQGRLLVDPDSIWEGTNANNTRNGTDGNDVMLGLGGNDTLRGGKGEDYIKGGGGDDELSGGNRDDIIEGEAGNDTLNGDTGDDQMFGGSGNDILRGGAGDDQMFGGDGADKFFGSKGHDVIETGKGNDTANGGGGNDKISALSGQNLIKGENGDDDLFGGIDADRIFGGKNNDELDGGAGKDKLFGGAGIDILRGGDGNDILKGDADGDFLTGGAGNDTEYGGAGNDTFYDSDGNDKKFGGTGADEFVYQDTDFGKDVIKDFEFGIDELDMGITARGLEFASKDPIKITELAAGVRFKVDADNWVLVEGAKLSDFQAGDYITDSPF